MKNITVLGLGYIGLPTAIVLAKAGHQVNGFDVNEKVIETLNTGTIHIVENNLQEAYSQVLESGKFKAFTGIQSADIYIICVPTPFEKKSDEKIADLTYVKNAAKMLGKYIKKNDLVILESTVPPLTTALMTEILEKESGLKHGEFYTAHCPERVLPGRILYELEHNDRIIGSANEKAAQMTKELYDTFVKEGTCYVTDDVTAEMCKLVENTYRDVNIAFANEISIICDQLGIDVFKMIELANKHPRVNIMTPGVGVGGHCLAVDPWFIVEKFKNCSQVIEAARKRNDYKPYWISDKVEELINYDKNVKIGILGLAYKPNIDDLRESPSIELAHSLMEKGYTVIACEPNVEREKIENIIIKSIESVVDEADYLVITLAHKEFLEEPIKSKILAKDHYNCIGLK